MSFHEVVKRVIRKTRRRRNAPAEQPVNSNSAAPEPRNVPRSGTWFHTFQMVTTTDPGKYAELTRYLGVS